MSKPAKIVFTISLILNVLFIGLAVGWFYHERDEVPPRPWDKTKEALAPETRAVLKATFQEKGKEIFPLFEEARRDKEAMKAIISAPEFDGDAYDALAAKLVALNGKFMEHRLVTIKTIFSQLPQSERMKMADHTVERILGNPPRGRHGRMGHYRNTDRFGTETSSRKKGAIEAPPGGAAFDARSAEEAPANQGE